MLYPSADVFVPEAGRSCRFQHILYRHLGSGLSARPSQCAIEGNVPRRAPNVVCRKQIYFDIDPFTV